MSDRSEYLSLQRNAARAAESGIGGPLECHAFLARWGASDEIDEHRKAQVALSKWWIRRGRDDVGPMASHLGAVLHRLGALYSTARRAEDALAKHGYTFDPDTQRLIKRRDGRPGRKPTLTAELVVNASGRFKGKRYAKARLASIRSFLRHVIDPQELTDARLTLCLQRHFGEKAPVRKTRKTPAR